MTNNIDRTPVGLLTGKVVFITGASRGIGAAAARLFAREGAAVVLAARSTDALEKIVAEVRADGGVADAVTVDLADRASIRAAIEASTAKATAMIATDGVPGSTKATVAASLAFWFHWPG